MRPNSVRAVLSGPPLTLSDVIRGGYFSHVTTLIQMGIDVNGRDADSKTPIMLCALIEDEDWAVGIARALIENGAKLNVTDKFGLSALHMAAIYEREKLIKILLSAADFDPNLQDKLGNTALHYASMSGNIDITRVLVQYWNKYGLDGGIRNRRGKTPLHLAYDASHYGCASQLIKLSTSTNQLDVTSGSRADRRPKTAIPRIHRSASSTSTVFTEISDQSVFTERPRSSIRSTLHSAAHSERLRSSRHDDQQNAMHPDKSRSSRHHSALQNEAYSNRPNSSRHCILPHEKNKELVIRSASRKDFRNKREYIFKLTSMPYNESDLCEKSLRNARARSCGPPVSRYAETPSWRSEFKRLFHEYEFQCSPSYRQAVKIVRDHVMVVTPDDEEADDRDRKRLCRRTSLMSRISSLSDKRRSGSSSRQRKVSMLPPGVHAKPSDAKPSDATDPRTSSSESSTLTQSWRKKETSLCKDVSRIQIHATDSASDQQNKGDNSSIPAVMETLVAEETYPQTDVAETGYDVDNSRLFVTNHVDN